MRRIVILLLLLSLSWGVEAQKRRTPAKKATTTRTTKRTTKKRSTTVSSTSIKGLQNQRQKIQQNIREQERRLRSNERDVKQRLQNLMMLNTEIANKRKTIDTISRDIHQLEGNIVQLNQELDTLQKQLDDRKQKYIKSMRYMHRNRSIQSQLTFIFSAKNFSQMYRRLRFVREYASFQKAQGEEVKSKQRQVTAKREELTATKKKKDALLYRGVQERRQLEGQQVEQQGMVNSLKKQQKTIQSIIDNQRKKDAALNAEIDRLIAIEVAKAKARAEAEARRKAEEARRREAEEARRREQELARKTESKAESKGEKSAAKAERRKAERRKTETVEVKKPREEVYTISSEDRRLSSNFESNRGRLPMPITGPYRIVSHFGQYNVEGLHNVRLDNKGINIKGQSGAQARSIFDGEVCYVFTLGGSMGVMVRHGSYISIYCNLSSVSVSRGQHVSTRQVLGTVGAEHILQFQLRKEINKLNPEVWLGR